MDWRVKMIGERVLGFVPYGEEIHSLFEGYRGYNVGRNLETKLSGKLLHISYLLKHTDFDFNGATILEIGTGWDGCDILLFYLLGANEVHTFDNIAHLSLGRVLEMLSVLTKNADEISSMFNIPIEVLERRMADIDDTGRDLTGFLRLCNIHYQAPAHFAYSEFDKEVDLFYTFSVLRSEERR